MTNIQPLHPDVVPDPIQPQAEPTDFHTPPTLPPAKPTYVIKKNYASTVLLAMSLFFIVFGIIFWLTSTGDESGLGAFISFFIIGYGILILIAKAFVGSSTRRILVNQNPQSTQSTSNAKLNKSLIYFGIGTSIGSVPFSFSTIAYAPPALTFPHGLFVIPIEIIGIIFFLLAIQNLIQALRMKQKLEK